MMVDFLTSQIYTIPSFIIYMTGLVLALTRWNRHPKVSMFAAGGFALMLFSLLIYAGLMYCQLNYRNGAPADFAQILGIVTFAGRGISAIAWIMLLFAVYGWRHPDSDPWND